MNQEISVPTSPLPKSVKVRSTCNACQQAKIRCSHEKPACRRCLKQNLVCIYSVSRRLGRPAKKRDPQQENDQRYRADAEGPSLPSNRKARSPRKKIKDETVQRKVPGKGVSLDNVDRMLLDQVAFDDAMMDDFQADAFMQNSCFLGGETESPFSVPDSFDLSSDSWLKEFMSTQPAELSQYRSILDLHPSMDTMAANEMASYTTGFQPGLSTAPDHLSSVHSYSPLNPFTSANEGLLEATSCPESLKREALAFTPPIPSTLEHLANNSTTAEASCKTGPTDVSRTSRDYVFSADAGRTNFNVTNPAPSRPLQCQCHEQIVKELIRVNICTCRTGPDVTIDSILSSQRLLQQLADTILQCGTCSKSGVNLLMVVVVSIDSLVTALEAIISVENGLMEGLFSGFHEYHAYSFCRDISSTPTSRWNKGGGFHIKAQVESCPLLVGGFCVPGDEKFSFVLQVLHSRLSGLLNTIRRIRLCCN
ncbi:C6 zinc finger domain protein [Aspergillus terreus]|uniref:C6 zinc finger domain protein n=1 Tax=Aspergillus terreus TaxID=33178 RepID=A0A5M3ZCJ7_ASPTE|nr:hypothetical protein ATETN484_0011050200 [Aspergillus terreus]GFF19144.1 C6 zinc finger domain protein [Aspergillus terreus]